jgi:replicative DNA helicase
MADEHWNNLTAATAKISDLNLYLDDQPALTLLEVRSKARIVKRRNGLNLLVVDYLGLMTGGPSENRNQEVGSYSRGLKALAKELDIPIIALAQLNRGLENRANKRPTMADLRDSGEIEQDADIIMFLYRDEVYEPNTQAKGICEVLVEKQRQGETGMVPLSYQGEFTLFGDLARGYAPPEPKAQPRKTFRDDL